MKKLLLLGLSVLLFAGIAFGQIDQMGGKNPITINKLYWPTENDFIPTVATTDNEVGTEYVMPDHDEMWTICKPSGEQTDSFDVYIIVAVKTDLLLSAAGNAGKGYANIDSVKVITADTLGGKSYLNTKVPPFASHYRYTVDGVTGNDVSTGCEYETWVLFKNSEVGNTYKTEKMFFPTQGDMIPSIADTDNDTSKAYQLPNKDLSSLWVVCKPSGEQTDSFDVYIVLQTRSKELNSAAGNDGVGWANRDSVKVVTIDTLAGKYYEMALAGPATEYRIIVDGVNGNDKSTGCEYETWVILKE